VRLLLQRALQGLEYLHALGVVHADVKPANILVDSAGMPRVTDFETSRAADAGTFSLTKGGGSLGFIAPELLDGSAEPTRSSDMFAFGKTLGVARKAMAALPDGAGGAALADLIGKLVVADADARLTASQALQHPYFTTDAAETEARLLSAAEARTEEARLEREKLDGELRGVYDQKCKLQRQAAEHQRLTVAMERQQREAGVTAAGQSKVRDEQLAKSQQLQEDRCALAQKEADIKRHMVAAGQYEWLDEHDGAWKPYPPDINKRILTAATAAAECSFDLGEQTYSLTTRFPMFQTNVRHGTRRHVRLTGGPADERFLREPPRYWRAGTASTEAELVELDPANPDMKAAFDDVVALVTRECALNVLGVSVVQDPAKWKAYNLKKAQLEAKLPGGANERRVVHGGSEASIRSIARMGFIREFNTASAHGRARTSLAT
jgi:hypothetical protein